jgi:hypothetical protein
MAQRSSDITSANRGETGLTRVDANDERIDLAADDATDETESIKAQIEETRAGMGETIDAIQEKLSLANISEQVSERVNSAIETAKDTVYDATVGKAVHFMRTTGRDISNSPVITTVRDNPLPFILIGLGAGMLAYQGFSRKGNGSASRYWQPRQFTGREDRESMMRPAEGGIHSVRDTVSNAAGTAYEGVTRTAGSAVEGVSRAAETAYHSAEELAHRAAERANDLGTRAQETYHHYLEEKPWAIGAIALAAGAAIGMAIPSTRYEGELMGEARMNLLNKAQESANEFIDKAKSAANEAGRVIKDEAKTLTEETLG